MKRFTLFLLTTALISLSFIAKAQTGVQNYVSASGYVIFNAPFYNTGDDGYAFDFESDYIEERLLGWKTIDADGDSYEWTLSPIGAGYGHNESNGAVFSYSYSNYSGALNPDNYLVSPKMTITANNHYVSFYACALDEAAANDHFGVAISTTGTAASDFAMLQEWTMTAKQGGWHQYNVDLNSYVGQDVYLAIRHFNSPNQFCIIVDDIFVGPQTKDPLVNCSITLDGAVVADHVVGTQYILDTEGFANGSTHTTTVTATYQSGVIVQNEAQWTYRSGDNFQGSPNGLHAESDGSVVNLSWELPMMASSYTVDEIFYDFSDETLSDLTLIDANGDGYNFRNYPFGGYGSGPCLRSDSWLAANIGNLDPDNYVVLPRVTATENTVFSFMAVDCNMPGSVTDPEHFGVAVSTNGNTNPTDFVMIQEWNSEHNYTEYSVDLSAYAGQHIYVAIRHFNTTGSCFYLYVDDVRITGVEAEITRPAKGALVYANGELLAMLNHGETSFTHSVNRYHSEYCIRIIQEGNKTDGTYFALAAPQCTSAYVECIAPENLSASYDGSSVTLSWERTIFTDFEDDPEGWTFLDGDGDGYVFGIYDAGGMEPNGSVNTTGDNASLTSFSYINGLGALTPNNYAFMPLTKILPGAKMEFFASGYDPNYPTETFGVMVASSDASNINMISQYTTSYPYTKYVVDLSAYAGQEVFLGFRHFSATAAYALCIDNITITNAVWSGTASYTDHYEILRSTDGVDYQVIGWADGDMTSYVDNDMHSVIYFYKVVAVNKMPGDATCTSRPAMSTDGIHDYVTVAITGINEIESNVSVYPNPTNGIVNIEAENIKNIVVFNTLGQKVFETVENQIDLSQFGTGLYMLKIETEHGNSVKRIMVK